MADLGFLKGKLSGTRMHWASSPRIAARAWVIISEQSATVIVTGCFFSLQTEIQLSNLGYLAVISLAHCHSYCFIGAFWGFSLGLSTPTRLPGTNETSGRDWTDLGSFWGRSILITSHGRGPRPQCIRCSHVPEENTGVYGRIPHLQGDAHTNMGPLQGWNLL